MRAWTEWDSRTYARGVAIAAFALLLVAVVTAASDEGGLTWGERAGRTLPLAPVCAAIGAWVALLPGRARGDDRALASLGRSSWERHAAAIVGGASVPLAAALLLAAVPRIDVRGFYPRAEESLTWSHDASGFVSGDGRWRVTPDGAAVHVESPPASEGVQGIEAASTIPVGGRASAALATALAGLALPMLVARSSSRRGAASATASIGVAGLATVLAFQAAAASRVPAALALLPPLFLLAWAASRYRSSSWSRAKSPR